MIEIEYSWQWFKANADTFDDWFDSNTFDWEYYSNCLISYCHNHFEKWWSADKFDWESSGLLAKHCSEYFDIWWDVDKYDWNWGKYWLTKYCMSYIDVWYDTDPYRFVESKQMLKLLSL